MNPPVDVVRIWQISRRAQAKYRSHPHQGAGVAFEQPEFPPETTEMNQQGLMIVGTLTVFVMGLAYLVSDVLTRYRGTRSLDKRIDRLAGNLGTDENGIVDVDRDKGFDLLPPEPEKGFFEGLIPELPSFDRYVEQADIKYKASQLLVAAAGLALAGFFLPQLLKVPYGLVMGVTFAVVFGSLPLLYVWWVRGARLKKFEGQLGEAMELVARPLRAGHSLA